MNAIRKSELPRESLLAEYVDAYTDCYSVAVQQRVSPSDFVEAFLTSRVFKLERWVLAWLVAKPSNNLQAKALARSEIGEFAAWRVENRSADQLLLCDFTGRTRSWLMSGIDSDNPAMTRLYFGSAVVPKIDAISGEAKYGIAFNLLLAFHRLYSRALLRSAISRLGQIQRTLA